MKWACIFITDIRSVQIGEICVRIFDEYDVLIMKYTEVYKSSNCLMSGTEYSKLKQKISSQLDRHLDGVEKIVVWDRTAFYLLSDVLKCNNTATRYVVVMKDSRYVPYRDEPLKNIFSKMELKLDDPTDLNVPVCEIMCEVISSIAIKTHRESPNFLNCFSEYRSIVKSGSKADTSIEMCGKVKKTQSNYKNNIRQSEEKFIDTPDKKKAKFESTADILIKERANKVRECCKKYGLQYRIDFDTVFINTWLSSWYFSLKGGKIRIRHENSRNKKHKQKFNEHYHDQKKEFIFDDIEKAIKYINYHDLGQKKYFR